MAVDLALRVTLSRSRIRPPRPVKVIWPRKPPPAAHPAESKNAVGAARGSHKTQSARLQFSAKAGIEGDISARAPGENSLNLRYRGRVLSARLPRAKSRKRKERCQNKDKNRSAPGVTKRKNGCKKRKDSSHFLQTMPTFPSDDFHIQRAAQRLRAGELVAFPTETVYGLGASALESAVVAKIYACKGRPAFNPLIVHVADTRAAQLLVSVWNERAEALAKAFWPGPLTLILPKNGAIPDVVSAGLDTVALRVPSAPVAQKLLRAAGIPLAAPSANASGEISPTRAAHVSQSLGDEVWILDGGDCEVGIESTVVDISGPHSSILRPGSICERDIASVIGPLTAPAFAGEFENDNAPRPSPGMMRRHYAPRARLQLFSNLSEAHFHAVAFQAQKIGVLAFSPTRLSAECEIILPFDAALYARQIYAALRQLDGTSDVNNPYINASGCLSHDETKATRQNGGCDLILVEEPPLLPAWSGVRDRLRRAARGADHVASADNVANGAMTIAG